MGVPTHVMEFSSGWATTKGGGSSRLQFVSPLRQLNGTERWFITFYALPTGRSYEEVRDQTTEEYIQAAGRAEAMMLDVRKPGGEQWGAESVRYFIGHPHEGNPPLDVPIELPRGPEFVSAAEVFEAEEAADIFISYYKTGDILPGYTLRPVEGYTANGDLIDLRGVR
ncbi:hypothetical protein [Mycobacteroides abscessus]|uniref:hypothetical protein n=1 Tax=Mycobacteroides abscessus TaxID=36809 RepID=UPI00092C8A03|nr:hypothetical protein [Mycobacteroides abscessus]MBE5451270.1 hypothetical protein [Mycobacteroides abscessus]MDO3212608.1 hypothetical protein [Mycobacteroides abscessus subsp. abscessus]MDO3352077.1 hypothetical protein [Mycobacteroides abscessus subsp. abscessus]PVA12433.1 hypothetical protein DDJ61_22830 [Mycobacteroides abscessus]PVA74392.1 hypothetical protein DDJ76_22475 [Mycobacteroides abscessus]